MFAIDIPTAVLVGFAIGDAGKKQLKTLDKTNVSNLRKTVFLFNIFFFTPVPLLFLNAWPGWQMNYVAAWADNLHGNPLRSAVVMFFFIITTVPAWLSFELSNWFIKKKKTFLPKVGWILSALVIILVIYITREQTLNIAVTYADYYAGRVHSITYKPFITTLSITTIYSWTSLGILLYMINKKNS